MFIERINRLNFLNKIAKQVFASENLIQKDMFTEAEKELPFKIKWVKKIWDEGSLSFDGYNDSLEPHQRFMSKSFFNDIFPDSVINNVNKNKFLKSLTGKYLDKFISDNWKFLFEISNEEGVKTEDDLKLIGSGFFGKAFLLPSGNILKIAERSYQHLGKNDDIFLGEQYEEVPDYGDILENKQQKYRTSEVGTRYLPKILELYRIILGKKTFYATLMKKVDVLKPSDEQNPQSVAVTGEVSAENTNSYSYNKKRALNGKILKILCFIKEWYNFFFREKLKEIQSLVGIELNNPYGIDEFLGPYFEFNQFKFERLWNLVIDSCIEGIEVSASEQDDENTTGKLSPSDLSNIENLKKLYFKNIKKECSEFIYKNVITSMKILPIKNDIEDYIKSTLGERRLRKMNADWFNVYIVSMIDSCMDSNVDISVDNIGVDDRGYIIIFDS